MSNAAPIARIVAVVAALVIGAVLAYGVLRLVGESRKQNCIDDAAARYAHVAARVHALDSCKAKIF